MDNKSKQDGRDRSQVSGQDRYEIEYFAERHGITAQQARDLIAKHGNNREELDRAAERIGAS